MVDRLGDDLPEIMAAITKAGGLAKVAAQLEKVSTRIAIERREAAREAERIANEAAMTKAREQALATRAARIARDRERAAAREAMRAAS